MQNGSSRIWLRDVNAEVNPATSQLLGKLPDQAHRTPLSSHGNCGRNKTELGAWTEERKMLPLTGQVNRSLMAIEVKTNVLNPALPPTDNSRINSTKFYHCKRIFVMATVLLHKTRSQ